MTEEPTYHSMEDAVRELDAADVSPATRRTVNKMRAEVLAMRAETIRLQEERKGWVDELPAAPAPQNHVFSGELGRWQGLRGDEPIPESYLADVFPAWPRKDS